MILWIEENIPQVLYLTVAVPPPSCLTIRFLGGIPIIAALIMLSSIFHYYFFQFQRIVRLLIN